MAESYVQRMRTHIGTDLLLLPSVAAILRDSAGHILFHQRTDDDRWSLPAGAIECGEDPWTALVREVYEETGYIIHDGFVRGVFGGKHGFRHTYPNSDQVEYTVIVFACSGTPTSASYDRAETRALRFFPPTALPPLAIAYPPEIFVLPHNREALFVR